jgi:ATP-binding cassette, subfamily B, bacterial MsbA
MFQSFKHLWPYLRPYRRDLVLMVFLGFGLTIFTALIPVLGQAMLAIWAKTSLVEINAKLPAFVSRHFTVDELVRDKVAFWLPFCFPLVFLISGIFKYLHYKILNFTGEKLIAAVRLELVRKVVRLNLSYYGSLERGTGGLISRVFNDTTVLQQGLNFYTDLIREPIQAAMFLGYMIYVDWKLTIGALLFLPFFLLITKTVTKSLRRYGNQSRDSMEDLTAVLKETVDGVRVVQSFNLEREMERRFQDTLANYLSIANKIITREQAVSPINEFVVSILIMGFGIYSIDQTLHHGADGSRFFGFLLAAGLLQAPIKKLQDAGLKIQQSIVVTDRIFALLASGSEVPESKNPKPFPRDWKTITFRNVFFNYGAEAILKNINLTVRRGEVLALVGESGSGKSTLVNLLERFYDPTAGEILVDQVPLSEINLKDLRANIALVTQDVFLFRDTIARNIHAGDFSKDAAMVESSARAANAHSFIAAIGTGYQSSVGERGSFLSGGEKQRVSIARAILKDAPVLILDEATSALDSVSEMEVQKGLNKLMEGRTAFVIAHRLSTIFSATRILVMKKGEIIEEGSHATLIERGGEYHNFFQLQMNHVERTRAGSEV